MASVARDPGIGQREEAGEPQMGDQDHHAEQQGDGVEVDGAVGLVEAERARRHHQARPQQRRAGAVEPQPRRAAKGDDEICRGEDEGGDHGRLRRAGQLARRPGVQQPQSRHRPKKSHGPASFFRPDRAARSPPGFVVEAPRGRVPRRAAAASWAGHGGARTRRVAHRPRGPGAARRRAGRAAQAAAPRRRRAAGRRLGRPARALGPAAGALGDDPGRRGHRLVLAHAAADQRPHPVRAPAQRDPAGRRWRPHRHLWRPLRRAAEDQGSAALPAAGGDRHRGPPLLPPFRRRPDRAGARGLCQSARRPRRAGRQHHHPAARQEPLPHPRPHAQAQDPGGAAGAVARAQIHQGRAPRDLSQPRLSRRRHLWRRRRGAALFRQIGAPGDALRGGGDRRAAQGADALQPGARSRPGAEAHRAGARQHGRGRLHHPGAGAGGRAAAGAAGAGRPRAPGQPLLRRLDRTS